MSLSQPSKDSNQMDSGTESDYARVSNQQELRQSQQNREEAVSANEQENGSSTMPQSQSSEGPSTPERVRARSNSGGESKNTGEHSPGGSLKPSTPPGWRVKLYQLCDSGKWEDKGTGYVRCIYLESVNSSAIQVISESDQSVGKVLLESQVLNDDVYRRQGETIITWNETVANHDLALSFQESEGCQMIWEQLCQVQGRPASDYHEDIVGYPQSSAGSGAGAAGGKSPETGDDGLDMSRGLSEGTLTHESATRELPAPSIEALEDIHNILNNAVNVNEKAAREHCADAVLSACDPVQRAADGTPSTSGTSEQDPQQSSLGNNDATKSEAKEGTSNQQQNGGAIDTDSTWLARLLSLFEPLESTKRIECLQTLFKIVKLIALLHDSQVYETMLDDRYFETVVGILEYDPDLPSRPHHREYLHKHVIHRQVVPITDADLLHKIHQNFRIGFLRDVLLPRSLDEPSFTTLSQMDLLNAVDIANGLHADKKFMGAVFGFLRNPPEKSKREAVIEFLHELCSLAKKLQVHARNAFYRSLLERDKFFDIFEGILGDASSSARERVLVTDILMLSLQHESSLLRNYIMGEGNHPKPVQVPKSGAPETVSRLDGDQVQKPGENTGLQQSPNGNQPGETWPTDCGSLLFRLIDRMVYDPEPGMQAQASEVIRFLLNPETMEVNEKDKFLTLFYEHYIGWLVTPLNRHRPGRTMVTSAPAPPRRRRLADALAKVGSRQRDSGGDEVSSSSGRMCGTSSGPAQQSNAEEYSLNFVRSSHLRGQLRVGEQEETMRVAEHHLCELLSFCVQTHGYRIKYYILRNDVVGCVLKLLHCREKHLVLDAIRFIRTCVGIKDNFYNRYFVRNNSFKGIFSVFRINGPRNNLINSAIIELLEFVRTENIKCLVEYIVQKFAQVFQEVSYVDTYQDLLKQHKENEEFKRNPVLPNPKAVENSSSTNQTPRSAFGERVATDEQEDTFFNEEDSDEETKSVAQEKKKPVKRTHSDSLELCEIGTVTHSSSPTSGQKVTLRATSNAMNGGNMFAVDASAGNKGDEDAGESAVKKSRAS